MDVFRRGQPEPQSSSQIDSLLLSVVSEKTGYPTDALSLEYEF